MSEINTTSSNILESYSQNVFIAEICGYISTILFTTLYIPQILHNFKRKSTKGFSSLSMMIKIIGGSFHFINAYILNEPNPVILYGFLGLISYSSLLIQIAHYEKKKKLYLFIIIALIIPIILSNLSRNTLIFTNSVKPVSQIASHLAFLYEIYLYKSTKGISILSQHLNLIGGFFGMYMLSIIPAKSKWTYFTYFNSLFQAFTTYISCFIYNNSKDNADNTDTLPLYEKDK